MSTPNNILDDFNTYSYHHILIICDGTETAASLTENTNITDFDGSQVSDNPSDVLCPKTTSDGRGQYIVLINGLTDSAVTIQSAKWSSVITPTQAINGEPQTQTMAVDGEITIREPMGVRFLNTLNEATKSLGTDANGCVFMLKTIFVGRDSSGNVEHITNIRPLLFFMYDIGATFDVAGSEYLIAFVGVVNGAGKLQHISSIGDGFNLSFASQPTLRQVIEEVLPAEIQKQYSNQKRELFKNAATSGLQDVYSDNYIDVEYRFKLHKDYHDFIAGDAIPPSAQNTGDSDPVVTVTGDSMSIESLLNLIMMSSSQVVNEASGDSSTKHIHKITSTLLTSPDRFIVEYQIQRYESAVIPVEQMTTFTPPEGQGIEFDYIFTGKNIDILNFDIKMQFGMTFFQNLNVAPSIPVNTMNAVGSNLKNTIAAGSGLPEGPGDQQPANECGNDKPRKKPLFLGMRVKNASVRNKRQPNQTANYSMLLARHAAYEQLNARMKIRGNPQLLSETTQLPRYLDPNIDLTKPGDYESPQVIQTSKSSNDHRGSFPAIHRLPAYVKVNVFMPKSASPSNPHDPYNGDFSENFWYPGWYYLLSIDHSFDNGEFTQELEMYSLPVDAGQSTLNQESAISDAQFREMRDINISKNKIDAANAIKLEETIAAARLAKMERVAANRPATPEELAIEQEIEKHNKEQEEREAIGEAEWKKQVASAKTGVETTTVRDKQLSRTKHSYRPPENSKFAANVAKFNK